MNHPKKTDVKNEKTNAYTAPIFSLSLLHPKYWGVWCGFGLLALLVNLLPYRLLYIIGRSLGAFSMRFAKRRVHIATRNLELAFPDLSDSEIATIVNENFKNTGMALIETGIAWFWPMWRFKRHIILKEISQVEKFEQQGKGALICFPHALNLEIGARAFTVFNKPGYGVYRPHSNAAYNFIQYWGRTHGGNALVDRKDLKKMLRVLKAGERLFYLGDHDYGHKKTVFVPFFAVEKASTTTGASILSALSKCALLPTSCFRNAQGNYELILDESIHEGYPDHDAEAAAIVMNRAIEKTILRGREQWMWLHRRYKTMPDRALNNSRYRIENKPENSIDKYRHNPTFQWSFLHPKHWLTWFGILLAVFLAFVPPRWRDRWGGSLAKLIIKKNGRVVRRARTNLELCFPEKSEQQREAIVFACFEKAAQYMLGYSEFLIRSTKHNQNRGVIIGEENLLPLLDSGKNVIILAPHAWAVDYPGVMLAAKGYKITTIMKPQKNPIGDWLMHVQRMQYGGRIFARNVGIKPFVRSIQDGYVGYWLPDEDHGLQNSTFVPFFATEKATLKGFGKMARLSNAMIVPVLPAYNDKTSKYEVHILPALEHFPSDDEDQDARAMNHAIETLLRDRPEQYMWNLYLLETQRDGRKIYS